MKEWTLVAMPPILSDKYRCTLRFRHVTKNKWGGVDVYCMGPDANGTMWDSFEPPRTWQHVGIHT